MMNNLPISANKKFKYSITFQSFNEESLEAGDSLDNGYEIEQTIDLIGDILYEANTRYGIYMPVSFGTWESTEPEQDRDFFEKGISKYYALHLTNEDGTEISQEESDFISFLLSDGRYEIDKFRDYAVGGIVLGAIVLGVGALITYFYFKDKKSENGISSNKSKSVIHTINGKDRKFPIKDAWKKEHSLENKSENYEVAQADRFKMGGDTDLGNGYSKEDYFLVVQNWVYFTFNYPMGFVKNAFGSSHISKHLQEKFSSSYERFGSVGVLMSFWANLDGKNREILSLWIKNNYFNSDSEKTELQSISDDNYAKIITHWNMFCFNFPHNFVEKVFEDNSEHFENKWVRSYERVGSTGAVNKFFTELSSNNQQILTDWVYDNYKHTRFADGGRVTTNDGIIEAFLTSNKQLKVGNLSTHFNEYENEILLRNYGTLIATREGNDVSITNTKYSKTTTIITNKVNRMALDKGMNVNLTDKFADGGKAGDKSVKRPIRKKRQPKVARTQFEEETYEYKNGGEAGKEKTINSKGVEYIITLVPTGDFTHTYNLSINRYSDEFGGSNHSVMQILSKSEAERMFQKVNESNVEDMYRVFAKMPTHKNKKFTDGGSADLDYSDILNVLKSKIDDSIDEMPMDYENSSSFTSEEIEHESRDGFIPYTDGGYQAVWFEYLSGMWGAGRNLPTKQLDDEMNRQIDYNLDSAKENFIKNYPEIVEELGEENIDYNSLYEAGYGEEAEELSNDEMEMMSEDTIMMRVFANYYNPENSRAKDGKHTIRLFGDVNLESPYHRTGNLDDSYEYEFTFDSISELENEMDKGLKQVISWFEGDMYNDSDAEMKVRRMKKGGRLSDKATYLGKRDIESIRTVYGQTIAGKKLLDGNYVKGKLNKPKMSRVQFEEETYEYEKGGEAGLTSGYDNYKLFLDLKKNLKPYSEIDILDLFEGVNKSKLNGYIMYEKDGSYTITRNISGQEIDVTHIFKSFLPYKNKSLFKTGGEVGEITMGKTASGNSYKRTAIGYVVGLKYQGVEILLNADGNWSNQHKTAKEKTKVFKTQELADKFIKKNQSSYGEDLYTRLYYRTEFFAEGGEAGSILKLYLKDEFSYKDSELIDEAIENGDIDTDEIKEDCMDYIYDRLNKEFDDKYTTEQIWEYTDENLSNGLTHKENYDNLIEFLESEEQFAEGGEVEDWMEQALDSLMEETGSTDLEISYVSDNGNSFYATDNNLEYRVFKSEDDAEEKAIEGIREDMEESPENFNQDFLVGYIDGKDFFKEALDEMNYSYAEDIASESDSKYANRLIAELVENGLMDEDDAESDNAEELADNYKDDYVALLTEQQLDEGNNGLNYFISNFGEEETYQMVRDNNLIDIDSASRDAVNSDGIAHFLSSYDGETLYLSDDYVAYRVN